MNLDSSAVQPCARWSVRVAVAATRAVARESLPAPRVDGVPACNRWGSTSDAWVQRDLTETVGAAHYHIDAYQTPLQLRSPSGTSAPPAPPRWRQRAAPCRWQGGWAQ